MQKTGKAKSRSNRLTPGNSHGKVPLKIIGKEFQDLL